MASRPCSVCVAFEMSSADTILHQCVELEHLDCMKLVLEAGTDVNEEAVWGNSALMVAAQGGHDKCVDLLIKAGADVNKQRHFGHTALMHAAQGGHVECVLLLIKAGADVNIQHVDSGNTALIEAAGHNHDGCVASLLEVGADVNTKNKKGETALINALMSHSGGKRVVKKLIQAGADVNKQTKTGWTALMHAVDHGCGFSTVSLLLRAGTKINITSNDTSLIRLDRFLPAGVKINIRGNEYNQSNSLTNNLHGLKLDILVHMLLYAAGETIDESKVQVPDYLKKLNVEPSEMSLRHLCREAVRKHMMDVSCVNLFYRVPRLRLPSAKYLLYNVSLSSV